MCQGQLGSPILTESRNLKCVDPVLIKFYSDKTFCLPHSKGKEHMLKFQRGHGTDQLKSAACLGLLLVDVVWRGCLLFLRIMLSHNFGDNLHPQLIQ